jgi:hypothetical protein
MMLGVSVEAAFHRLHRARATLRTTLTLRSGASFKSTSS